MHKNHMLCLGSQRNPEKCTYTLDGSSILKSPSTWKCVLHTFLRLDSDGKASVCTLMWEQSLFYIHSAGGRTFLDAHLKSEFKRRTYEQNLVTSQQYGAHIIVKTTAKMCFSIFTERGPKCPAGYRKSLKIQHIVTRNVKYIKSDHKKIN